jgi:undecaprenyl-diphosphatase
MTIGFLSAALTGYFCLALLVQLVKKNRLSVFSYYCWAVGLAAAVLVP